MKPRLVSSAAALVLLELLATGPPSRAEGGRETFGAEAESLAAVRRGLEWLAREQDPRGAWVGDVGHKQEDDYLLMDTAARQREMGEGHVGVTALAGLAFLAGGHVPGRGGYGPVVSRTTDYLLSRSTEDGYITESGTRMYSHGFATLYLAQVYGMERRSALKETLQKAVDLVVGAQNHQGGWRYNPFVMEADLSVTVTQLQALRAARNVGIHVPKSTIDRAVAYVRRSRIGYGDWAGAYYYKIEGRSARTKTSFAVNAAALTALMSAGDYDFESLEPAFRFIEQEYDSVSRWAGAHFYFWYGNYYACQAMFQLGGPRFERYYERLRSDLIARQRPDGSWLNSTGPGSEFSTAVACILLEVKRQLLPIFER